MPTIDAKPFAYELDIDHRTSARTTHDRSGGTMMHLLTDPIVFSRLLEHASTLHETARWEPFRPGVSAHWLYHEQDGGPAAVLLRYEPGARVALHEHVGYEHLLVLEGDQYDEDGSYPTGSLVINPPGTKHSPGSTGGCLALLIYERAVRFVVS